LPAGNARGGQSPQHRQRPDQHHRLGGPGRGGRSLPPAARRRERRHLQPDRPVSRALPVARHLWCALLLAALSPGPLFPATFIPGDANSSGAVNLTDAVAIFRYIYLGDGALLSCRVAADVDGNARIELTDGIRLLAFLFLGGEAPVYPQGQLGPGCGIDTPEDPLGCDVPGPCGAKGLFFVLDKSGSMNEGTKFRRLQTEVIRALDALSESDEFGIIFFDSALSKFPASGTPVRASAAMKAAGMAYVLSTAPGHGSCP